jgi:hypothetical protein
MARGRSKDNAIGAIQDSDAQLGFETKHAELDAQRSEGADPRQAMMRLPGRETLIERVA